LHKLKKIVTKMKAAFKEKKSTWLCPFLSGQQNRRLTPALETSSSQE
jgi:hypothetical protein